jgi:hypothetical protein
MGYRGDDASQSWADSRRQQPWRPSEGAPASAAGPRHAGAQGYEPDGEYPSADGYGVYEQGPRRDGYGDYGGQHGYAGHGQPGGHDGGYGSGPYGGYDGYGDAGAFDGGHGYDAADGFGDGNGYPEAGRHGRSPGYPGQDPSRNSGGYSIPGDYGREDSGGYDRPAGGFPDNDWYGDSRGGGFADTSIHVRPSVPDGYRPGDYDTGARPAGGAPEALRPDPRDAGRSAARGFPPARAALPAPPAPEDGLTETRQQRALDDKRYDTATYPGYENVDDQPGVGGYGTGGYPAQGYDDYDDYANFTPDYDMPAPTTANPAYVEPAATTGNPAYTELEPEYDEPGEFASGPGQDGTAVIDGYDDSFDYQDMGNGRADAPQDLPGKKGKAGKGGNGRKPRKAGKTAKSGKPRRSRKVAVLGLSAICLVVAVAAVYILLIKPSGEEATANAPLPSPGSTSAVTAACAQKLGQYCHIELRTDDPKPLTIGELFPPAVENTQDHISFQRIGTKIDKTCSDAVLGTSLSSALQSGKCTQVLRASYVAGRGSSEIMGTIGVANLSTTNQAHYAGKLVGENDFLSPLATSSGVGANLGQSTGEMQASFKGHYLILTWAELANEATPTSSDNKKLIQFENDLVTVTANIALSQRMVSGQPGTGN